MGSVLHRLNVNVLIRPGTRRAGWALANEGIGSASNLFMSVWVARQSDPAGFGAFGLVYVGVQLGIVVGWAVANMPMTIAFGGSEERFSKQIARQVTGASLLVGIATSLVLTCVAAITRGDIGSVALAGAFAAPGVILQDCCAYVFYARQQPKRALTTNVVKAGSQAVLYVGVGVVDITHQAWAYVGLWGIAAYAAVAVGAATGLGTVPRPDMFGGWWRDHHRKIIDLTTETAIGQISQQGIVWVLGIRLSLVAVAGFRAAQLPFGTLRIFIQGLIPMGLAEGVRLFKSAPFRMARLIRIWSLGGATLTCVVGLVLIMTPLEVGEFFLGQSWVHARPVLVAVTLASGANAITVPVQTGIRALGATRVSMRMRIPLTLMLLGGVLVGAYAGTLRWATIGYAVGAMLGSIVAICTFEVTFRRSVKAVVSTAPSQSDLT